MTKPDSTDAGGVPMCFCRKVPCECTLTVGDFYAAMEDLAAMKRPAEAINEMGRFIQQQEAALATLTRERDGLRALATRIVQEANKPRGIGAEPRIPTSLLRELEAAAESATPPAPLPGGQGPVEALSHLKEARQHWRTADNYDGEVGIDAMCASLGHVLSYLEDLEQERRDGLGKDSAKGA